MDLYYFPFDTQHCSVKFMNWNYREDLLIFLSDSREVQMHFYTDNQEWVISSTSTFSTSHTVAGDGLKFRFQVMGFKLDLKRQPLYYILNILVPCIILSLLSVVVFLLPTESGEKVSFGITVLLSYTIVMVMVTDTTPQGGKAIPVLGLKSFFFRKSLSSPLYFTSAIIKKLLGGNR